MEIDIALFIINLVQKFPYISGVLLVVGVLRVINKPLFVFLRTFVSATPTPKDDQILDQVETSKAYKTLSFLLDWVGSIKLPQPAPAPVPAPKKVQ